MSNLFTESQSNRGCLNCGDKDCVNRSIGIDYHMVCYNWKPPKGVVRLFYEELDDKRIPLFEISTCPSIRFSKLSNHKFRGRNSSILIWDEENAV